MQEEQRLSNMLDEIAHVRLCPTHRDIADVLGIPKGTVDSGLYYLKESFGALCN
jgi:DNA-directed RNA polymerase specialized sigma24 family protein